MKVEAENIKPYDGDDRAKGEQVRDMFDSIAPAYDFMNRAMTLGIDNLWRKKAVAIIRRHAQRLSAGSPTPPAALPHCAQRVSAGSPTPPGDLPHRAQCVSAGSPYHILDVATGTGDLAIHMARAIDGSHITGIDLSQGMVDIGRKKVDDAGLADRVTLGIANCLALPFDDDTFDCVSVAFGVRNFEHLDAGYAEMLRVLRPGGLLVVLELAVPANALVKPLYRVYTKHIIPLAGRLVSKDVSAYSYLPASIEAVAQRSQMTALIESVGFTDARFQDLTLGVCCLYTAKK